MEFHGTVDLPRAASGAFWAAYKALAENEIALAQVRAEVAQRVVSSLLHYREQHGLGQMLTFAQGQPDIRQYIVDQIRAQLPETFTSATRRAVDAAVVVAARALAEG